MVHHYDVLFDFNSEHQKNRGNVGHTCNIGMEQVITVENVHTFETAIQVIEKNNHGFPILFPNFVTNPAEVWSTIEEKHRDAVISFTDLELHGFGNLWVGGAAAAGNEKINLKLGEFFEASNKLPPNKSLYAAFVKFVNASYVRDDLKSIEDSVKIKADTNFIANFPYDMLATPIHAAPLGNSYSIQYLGRKLWIFFPPGEMEEYDAICTPSTLVMKGSEEEYIANHIKMNVVVQKEGDLLYFPANWGHAVITQKGPNVMLNLRQTGVVTSFLNAPFRALEGVLSVISTMAGRRVYSHTTLSPLQSALQFHPNITDSPCAGRWKEMLNA